MSDGNQFQFLNNQALDNVMLLKASMTNFSYGNHAHEEYSFGVTLSGCQDFFANGKMNKSNPGQVIALNPGDAHDGESGGDAASYFLAGKQLKLTSLHVVVMAVWVIVIGLINSMGGLFLLA